MITLCMSCPYSVYVEAKEHLYLNGYHFIWDEPELLMIDSEEAEYAKEILRDRGIICHEE